MAKNNSILLYIELLKREILCLIRPEKYIPLLQANLNRDTRTRLSPVLESDKVRKALLRDDLEIVKRFHFDLKKRMVGLDYPPPLADTMIGLVRMNNLQHCVNEVIKKNIYGDFIETGVWRGGACVFMRGMLKAHGIKNRRVWVADSFRGLPKPSEEKYPNDADSHYWQIQYCRVSLKEVKDNFRKYGLLDNQVIFLQGWFKDTLPKARIKKLAILRLDGDMYESTADSLNNLYSKVSKGGFVIIDDYSLPECRVAVSDFCAQQNISPIIRRIDQDGVFWKK